MAHRDAGEAAVAYGPFSVEEHAAIRDAIEAAEQKTSGEIVAVVARASDGYQSFAFLWAALLALSLPLPLIFIFAWSAAEIYLAQLTVFTAAAIALQWERLRLALVPGPVKSAFAHRRAVEQFLVQNLHTTEGRTGVLIYVSLAERFAEVIADTAIYQKVAPETWTALIDDLTDHLGRGEGAKGFVAAVERCGRILADHFPIGPNDKNELPNHLIVL